MAVSYRAPSFMTEFHCIGSDCPDTCCKGWNMQLGHEKQRLYAEQAPELLQALVTDHNNEYIMKRDARTDYCVKFSDGLCGIQMQYNESFLGDACYFYPRVTRHLGTQVIMTGTLSCPEIARLGLFADEAFAASEGEIHHLPTSLKNYLPEGMAESEALELHHLFMRTAFDASVAPEQALLRIMVVAESLERINVGSWREAAPFYLGHADSGLPEARQRDTDPVFLLQSLCGLVFAAKKINNNPRLMQTIADMEAALHVKIRMDTLEIIALPDSIHAARSLLEQWASMWSQSYAPVLRRYLAMQLSLAIFPFGGFGVSLSSRIAVIGIRLAYIKLGLMSACAKASAIISQADTIRVIQSLSRFLDHLGDPEFSLKIYQETGWLDKARLRGVLQC